MAGLLHNLFRKKLISEPKELPAIPSADLAGIEAVQRVVMTEEQARALSEASARSSLREIASYVLGEMNPGLTRIELYGKEIQGMDDGLRLMRNPKIHSTLKDMFERCWREDEPHPEFEQCFHLGSPEYEKYAVPSLVKMLGQFDRATLPFVDYTDAESVRTDTAAILKQGFEAELLSVCVQGDLRMRVNSYLEKTMKLDEDGVLRKWKNTELLGGLRNSAIDILEFYATEAFEIGELPQKQDMQLRQKLDRCASSFSHVNDSCMKAMAGRPLADIPPRSVLYICRGGDYRAFKDMDERKLLDIMSGKSPELPLRHRNDYILAQRNAQRESDQGGSRTRIAIEQLEKKEKNTEERKRHSVRNADEARNTTGVWQSKRR